MAIAFPAAIRAARERAGISQAELAQRVGCGQPLISGWERGARLPSVESLAELARALGVTADELLGLTTMGDETVILRGRITWEMVDALRQFVRDDAKFGRLEITYLAPSYDKTY